MKRLPTFPSVEVVETVQSTWKLPLQPAGCPQCGQAFLVEPSHMGQVCPNCVRGELMEQPIQVRSEPPELLVPFQFNQASLQPIIAKFIKEVWLRPSDLHTDKLLQRITPIFCPMWLVDCTLVGIWEAEFGFDYQVKSSKETLKDGSWQSFDVVKTKTRWEPRTGQLRRSYDNIPVPALEVHDTLQQHVGNYDYANAQPYQPTMLGGADVRIPDLQPHSAWPLAESAFHKFAEHECQQAADAQYTQSFALDAKYEAVNWTQLLLPLYVTYYTDDAGERHPLFINGQSGQIGGLRKASQRKGWKWAVVLLVLAAIVFLLSIATYFLGGLLLEQGILELDMLELEVLAGALLFVALIIGGSAIVPAVWPWRWNSKQRKKEA